VLILHFSNFSTFDAKSWVPKKVEGFPCYHIDPTG
jgi:hypothetical protein